jgi:hypothetical protein
VTEPPAAAPTGPRLAIGAIVKNEGPYLLEWIAYHRIVGIDRFFIADNASTDEGPGLLAALAAAGIVRHLPFPDRPSVRPQLPAYAEILRHCGGEADWIAFLDADEFLVPAPGAGAGGLRRVVAALGAAPEVGAIAVNWAVYGSSGHLRPGSGLVIERFTRRAARFRPPNHHFKSIIRTAAVGEPGPNPHVFELGPSFRTVHCDGREIGGHPAGRRGLSRDVVWNPLRINHYVVKSREEFMTRKLHRGRATTAEPRPAAFFDAHDLNDTLDPVGRPLVAATRRERDRLALLAAAVGQTVDAAPFACGQKSSP